MIDPNRLSPELRQRLAALMAKHEGDFTSAANALRAGSFAAGSGKQIAQELRDLVRQLEVAEERENIERARRLREHLERRGAVTTDQSLDGLADPYASQGRTWR